MTDAVECECLLCQKRKLHPELATNTLVESIYERVYSEHADDADAGGFYGSHMVHMAPDGAVTDLGPAFPVHWNILAIDEPAERICSDYSPPEYDGPPSPVKLATYSYEVASSAFHQALQKSIDECLAKRSAAEAATGIQFEWVSDPGRAYSMRLVPKTIAGRVQLLRELFEVERDGDDD